MGAYWGKRRGIHEKPTDEGGRKLWKGGRRKISTYHYRREKVRKRPHIYVQRGNLGGKPRLPRNGDDYREPFSN